jgi:hypothetical protein
MEKLEERDKTVAMLKLTAFEAMEVKARVKQVQEELLTEQERQRNTQAQQDEARADLEAQVASLTSQLEAERVEGGAMTEQLETIASLYREMKTVIMIYIYYIYCV